MAAGLPREGHSDHLPYAGDLAAAEMPTCGTQHPLADVAAAMQAHEQGFRVVVTEGGLVLGMLDLDDARKAQHADIVEQAMRPAPTTVRANEPVETLLEGMSEARLDRTLVTNPEGRLLGVLNREQAQHTLHAADAE